MKTKILMITCLLTVTSFAQVNNDNYLFNIRETRIGGYVSLGARYTTSLNEDPATFGDVKGVLVFKGGWGLGLVGSGLYYHKTMSNLVNDGTYHFNASYGAIYVEKIFDLNKDFKLSVSVASGSGTAFLQYDKNFQKDKKWTEEIIDQTIFYIFEPGLEFQYRISGNWWVSAYGTYRNTSPLNLIGADEDLFRKFSAGISFKWGIL